ncbi:MAG: pentapeptide repeat-containing protein [Calditrichae bacterium]|nr:pentapeptide repeat-containing protein [Calditrichia bacterium]
MPNSAVPISLVPIYFAGNSRNLSHRFQTWCRSPASQIMPISEAPDLRGADLSGTFLAESDFNADLSNADLSGANLSGANFKMPILCRCQSPSV